MAGTGIGNTVVIDGAALALYLRGPDGPVIRRLLEDAEIVRQGARRRVHVWQPAPGDPFAGARAARRRPGTLRDSIVKRITETEFGVGVEIGSDDEIALIHHEGTQPHTITARNRPNLVFFIEGVGVIRKRSVQHPGTEPNRYLTDSLADLAGRY